MDVLNPTLYNLLLRHPRFHGDVGIAAQGVAIDWYVVQRSFTDSRTDKQRSKPQRKVRYSGEEYRVNCPYCRDTRRRLFINHRWAVRDPDTGGLNLFLARCFNEECIYNYTRQQQLYELIMAGAQERTRVSEARINRGIIAPTDVSEVTPPGLMVPLSRMKKENPEHEAILYLESRGFDCDYLYKRFGVCYCPKSRYALAQNRIIAPFYEGGELVGWQARYVGDDVNGRPFNEARVPKFWSCPRMCRRMLAYNRELAQRHQTVVIVEGPTDTWKAGPWCMGVIGKTMHPDLVMRMCQSLDDDQIICIALDPKQDEKAKARGKPHHIEALRMLIAKWIGDRVFPLYLPEEADPGSLDRDVFCNFIYKAAQSHGLTATFRRPRK
jgi:hypothetical protein